MLLFCFDVDFRDAGKGLVADFAEGDNFQVAGIDRGVQFQRLWSSGIGWELAFKGRLTPVFRVIAQINLILFEPTVAHILTRGVNHGGNILRLFEVDDQEMRMARSTAAVTTVPESVRLAVDGVNWFALIRLKAAGSGGTGSGGTGFDAESAGPKKKLVGIAPFEPAEIQDLGDVIPNVLELKAKSKVPIQFQVRIELGDGTDLPAPPVAEQLNRILATVKEGFRVQ